MSRRGSMQLSIEAIIVLVIAFVLLGLGIVFVKDFFAQAGENTQQQIGLATQVCNAATGSNPFVPKNFQIQQGKSIQKEICVFNNADKPLDSASLQIALCIDPDGTEVAATVSPYPIQIIAAPLPIARGEGQPFQPTIRVDKSAKLGTYICNVYAQQKGLPDAPKVGPVQVTFEVV